MNEFMSFADARLTPAERAAKRAKLEADFQRALGKPICPECANGKHINCGPALNEATDEIVPCECGCAS